MAYQYDVFLSYRRSNDWPRFVENHFIPKFQHWLDAALGHTSKIFFDVRDIETGDAWPYKLANGLAHSKTMVCLWSREYFSSRWCELELTQMLARRKSLVGPLGPPPLILAVVIHDSEDIDPSLTDIQRFTLRDYCNPWIAEGSQTAERLSVEIEKFARDVADALAQAPEYDAKWPELVTAEFLHLFDDGPNQDRPPSLG
jgi:TIR domain